MVEIPLPGTGKPYPLLHVQLDPIPYVLETITDWANVHRGVRAVLLTSTQAVPGAHVDALSDYDVILIVKDLRPWVADRTWLNDFGEVLVVYWDPVYPDPVYGIEVCANVTQYVRGLKIDFTLWPVTLFERMVTAPALPAEMDAGYRVLLDKDHLTDNLRPPTFRAYLPQKPSQTDYETHVNDFLTDAPYVAKCLWRGELFPIKWALDFDMKHVYLRKVLEWRASIERNWTVPIGSLGKGLKRHLPAELWAQVEATFAGAGMTENWAALDKTMTLFRQVAVEVGEHLGYPYPHDLHDRVRAYVDHIRQMEPSTDLPQSA